MYYYILGGMAALLVAWVVGSYLVVRNLEAPAYTVLEERAGYEIRQYQAYIVAETTVTGNFDDGLESGFRVIADYIFGNNTTRASIAMTTPVLETTAEKISMTVPVISTLEDDAARTVSFVLPAKYTLETLPQPNNPAVNLREVAAHKVAALRFTGYATTRQIEKQSERLKALLAADNVEVTGVRAVAQYDPPLSFPFTRRNEILISIED